MTDKQGRAKILEAGEKIDAGEYTLEDMMAQIEAIPSNKRLLRQIGVRESVQRVRAHKGLRGAVATAKRRAILSPALSPSRLRRAAAQCLSAKARYLAEYEMEDPRVLAIIVSLMGWEMEGVGAWPVADALHLPAHE